MPGPDKPKTEPQSKVADSFIRHFQEMKVSHDRASGSASSVKKAPVEKSPGIVARSKKYISRLFLGEADFSFTKAYTEKHPKRGPKIIATELCSKEELVSKYPDSFVDNVHAAEEKGVQVRYGVDATKLHEEFPNQRIKRIHFNFPYHSDDKTGSARKQMTSTSLLLKAFFESASHVQRPGDRVYMALPEKTSHGYEEGGSRSYWLGYMYGLPTAVDAAGYVLKPNRKRAFQKKTATGIEQRYPGYRHRATNVGISSSNADNAREYVFEKRDPEKEVQGVRTSSFYYATQHTRYRYYDNVQTDPESSEDSGDEVTTSPKAGA